MNITPENEILARYTDEKLQADIAKYEASGQMFHRGDANRARHLLTLDTPARRRRASDEGSNLIGGRPSDSVHDAVRNLQRLIENGQEDRELYGERTARTYREQEAERRNLRFGIHAR